MRVARFVHDGRRARLAPVVLVAALVVFLAAPAGAAPGRAPGTLDRSFGGGTVTTDFGGTGYFSADMGNAVVIQPDGRIIVAGSAGRGPDDGLSQFALARYRHNGRLDRTFGDGGLVMTDVAGKDDFIASIALLPDGRIVAGGGTRVEDSVDGIDFALARYLPDGALDRTFGGDGRVTTDFVGGHDVVSGIAVQPDGRVVAAGVTFRPGGADSFGIARYRADGSLDPTFGTGGRVAADLGGDRGAWANALALQPDGRIVVGGSIAGDFGVARFGPDGSLDPSFGDGGVAVTAFERGGQVHALSVGDDGRIVAAGRADDPANMNAALVRYRSDGTPDPTFGDGGRAVLASLQAGEPAYGLLVQPDGRSVIVTASHVARIGADGLPDTGFGAGGQAPTTIRAVAIARQADGRLVVAGRHDTPLPDGAVAFDFGLARHHA